MLLKSFTNNIIPVINTQIGFCWADQGFFCLENLSNSTSLENSSSNETKIYIYVFIAWKKHTLWESCPEIHSRFWMPFRTRSPYEHIQEQHTAPWFSFNSKQCRTHRILNTTCVHTVADNEIWRRDKTLSAEIYSYLAGKPAHCLNLNMEIRERPGTLSPPLSDKSKSFFSNLATLIQHRFKSF